MDLTISLRTPLEVQGLAFVLLIDLPPLIKQNSSNKNSVFKKWFCEKTKTLQMSILYIFLKI
jgi:hypothetical protein